MKTTDLIRNYFTIFHARDRDAADAMLSDDFTFSSPLDDKIDKKAYFERCWPNGDHQSAVELEKVFGGGDEVFVTYSGSRLDGCRFRNTEFFRTQNGKITQVEVFFGTETAAEVREEELRSVLSEIGDAIRAKDATAMVSHYAADVLAFDLIDPLQYGGKDKVRQRGEEWLASWSGPIEFDMRDLVFSIGAKTAFCHSLNHVSGTKQDGQHVDMWWRATMCFDKRGSEWLVTHLHSSVPFNMETGKVSLDIKPDEGRM